MLDNFAHTAYIWIAYYCAGFCLLTIAAWAGGAYLWGRKWQKQVRDSAVYLLSIGSLSLTLALRPEGSDAMLWRPITWFCFTMLMVIELLWLTFLFDTLCHSLRTFLSSLSPRVQNSPSRLHTQWPRY